MHGYTNEIRADGGFRSSLYSENTEHKNKSLAEKKRRLLEEFQQYDTSHSHLLERDEVKAILDQRLRHTGRPFDDELIDAIFNNIDRDLNGRISKQEFCDGYVDVENFFCENIATCNYKIMELKNIKSEYETQLREAAQTEVTNQYGIMEKSVLTVTVIEARYIKLNDYNSQADLYVILECGNHSAQTKHIEGQQNPVWDETFHFDINNGKEEIKVSVLDRNMMKQDTLVGTLYIPIETLSDQVKVEDWFNLENPHGGYGESSGRIRLQLWWIHSKTKLIEDRIIQTEEDIDKILGDKKYYQDKVQELREPFAWLEGATMSSQSQSKSRPSYSQFNHKEIDSDDEESKNNPIVAVVNKVGDRERLMARQFEILSDNFAKGLGLKATPWFKIMQWFNIIYMVLTLITLFLRTDFINLTVCVLIFYCISYINWVKRWHFRIVVGGLVISWLADVAWMILRTTSWWSRAAYDGDVELTLRRICVVVTYLSFLFRFFLLLIFWKLSVDFSRLVKNRHEQSETGTMMGSTRV